MPDKGGSRPELDSQRRPDIPEAMQQIGRQYFARQRGGAVWVCFDDLPPITIKALFDRLSRSRSKGVRQ